MRKYKRREMKGNIIETIFEFIFEGFIQLILLIPRMVIRLVMVIFD